jgi:hypothetical protein
MSNTDDAWHVRIPRRLRASIDRIAETEDRHPAQVVRRLLIRALAQHEQQSKATAMVDGPVTAMLLLPQRQ